MDPIRNEAHATRRRLLVACVASVLIAAAQPTDARPPATTTTTATATTTASQPVEGDVRRFELTPAAVDASVPAPRLLPRLRDRIDANAATLYLQANLMVDPRASGDALDSIEAIEADEAYVRAVSEVAPWLDSSMPELVQDAARAARVDWGLPARTRTFATSLPHLNDARVLANLLCVKSRLAAARGDAPAAIELIAASCALADRLDEGEALAVVVNFAVRIQEQNTDRLARIVQLPGCPNLYWSLRQMPQPFGNLRVGAEVEQAQTFWSTSLSGDTPPDERSGAEWALALAQLRQRALAVLGATVDSPEDAARVERLSDPSLIRREEARLLPAAREHYLKTRHVDRAVVDELDPQRVIGVYMWESSQTVADAQLRLFALPYTDMLPRLGAAVDAIRAAHALQPTNPFLELLPRFHRYAQQSARLDRMIAALTCVEALRAHAATRSGKLPATLAAVVDTPPPLNPVDGQAFDYVLHPDGSATLSDGGELIGVPLRYELRMRE